MSLTLFYDFETTGLPDYKARSSAEHQPHIVSVGAILVDDTWNVVQEYTAIVKPDLWSIPSESIAIHGITNRHAQENGTDERTVVHTLHDMAINADLRVGYNEPFDARIMRIALNRHHDEHAVNWWKGQPSKCAMQLARPICGMSKAPTLSEAVSIILSRQHIGAHDAMADVRATVEVYRYALEGVRVIKAGTYLVKGTIGTRMLKKRTHKSKEPITSFVSPK